MAESKGISPTAPSIFFLFRFRAMNPLANLKNRKFVKDFKGILKDIEPHVRAVKPLWSGREFPNFSLRPREVWSLWLLCVVLHNVRHEDITFGEDDESDGILVDPRSGEWIKVENVSAMDFPADEPLPKGTDRIVTAIETKSKKGDEYAKGKILIVFFDGSGEWYRNKVRESIKGKHNFERVYLIGLLTDKGGTEYSYSITDLLENDSITYKVQINPDFTDWTVSRMP